MNTRPYSDELKHYGVKGMKWGVRRYQDKNGKLTAAGKKRYAESSLSEKLSDIESRKRKVPDGEYYETLNQIKMYGGTLPSGSKVYRMSHKLKDGKPGNKYIAISEMDTKQYKAYWRHKEKAKWQIEYEAAKPLKIAGALDMVEAYISGSNFSKMKLGDVQKTVNDYSPEQHRYIDKLLETNSKNKTVKSLVRSSDPETLYNFILGTGHGTRGYSLMSFHSEKTDPMIERLKRKGFDGVIDIEDAYMWSSGHATRFPAVVFDNNALIRTKASYVTDRNARKTSREVYKWETGKDKP